MRRRVETANLPIRQRLRRHRAGADGVEPEWLDWGTAIRADSQAPAHVLAAWFQNYVMLPHPDLGRPGHVCPYMAQAARLNLVRIGISDLTSDRYDDILNLVIAAQSLFDALACPGAKRVFRAVIVAFPACADASGIVALQRVQYAVRFRSALGRKMVGLFEPASTQPGIVNPAFLSFRCPVPVIAIRSLVEADAPFVLRNPLMLPSYLLAFGASGRRCFVKALRRHQDERRQGMILLNSVLVKFRGLLHI